MVQPGLSAHTVLTVSEGPALVAGFEGKSHIDTQRQQVLNYYSARLQRERKLLAYRNCAYTKLWEYLADTGREKTELGQHIECFQIDGKQRFVGQKIGKSRRHRRAANFPRVVRTHERQQAEKKVKSFGIFFVSVTRVLVKVCRVLT